MRTDELDYDLPPEMIATHPANPRDSARMLVLWRSDPKRPIEHRRVRDLPEYLLSGDALVFNNTAVIPARFLGRRVGTGGRVEGLFLEEAAMAGKGYWKVMLKAGGRLHAGDRIELVNHAQEPSGCILALVSSDQAEWVVRQEFRESAREVLDRLGWTPLPPYILKARGDHRFDDQVDRRCYQTVFADYAHRDSVAAPTAGLHFTRGLFEQIDSKGVRRIEVTLHVGAGTFKPVNTESIEQHPIHAERFEVSASAARDLRSVLSARPHQPVRLLAVGTTSVRTLESLADALLHGGDVSSPLEGETRLLITPPYQFRIVDGMLTNFHLPRSTLLALVAAMIGVNRVQNVYRLAVANDYRFYSYGDAMLILP